MVERKWEALGLFSVPLVKLKIEDVAAIRELFFSKIVSQSDVEKNNELDEAAQKLSHFNNNTDVFGIYPELAWLKETIEQLADFVYHDLLNYKNSGAMRITNAWFNLAKVGAAQTRHAHANSLLSGTLYINTDADTSITFYHPNSTGSLHPELYDQAVQKNNEHGLHYHFTKVDVAVKQGECLFWPSQLLHGYENNKTPDRLSFSFNLMPERLNSVYQVSNAHPTHVVDFNV